MASKQKDIDPYANVIRFILNEKFLTIAVIGSVITFQFLTTFKTALVDPLLDFALPTDKFGFMNITIREGDEIPPPTTKLSVNFGAFFIEMVKYAFMMVLLFLLAKYTRFPDTVGPDGLPRGNWDGSAIM